jgi:hypothetical protein
MGPRMYEQFLSNGDNRLQLELDNYIKVWYIYIKLFNVIKTNLL